MVNSIWDLIVQRMPDDELIGQLKANCVSKGMLGDQSLPEGATLYSDIECLEQELKRRLSLVPK